MKHIIMANPVSGKKKGHKYAKIVQKLLNKYGIDAKIILSTYAGELREKAYTLSHIEKTRFYVIGGDGTLNEVASGTVYTDSDIVVLPCGTGNDFARYINEYKSLRKIVLTSINTDPSKIDIIELNGNKYCINVLNAGFDAHIALNMNKFRWVPFVSGTTKYNLAIIYTLFLGKNYRFRIKTNEFTKKGRFTLMALSNARYYGGGVVPSMRSTPDDGKLSICAVGMTTLLMKLVLLPKYKKGKHEGLSLVTINDNINNLSLVSNKKFPVSIDGEIIYTNRLKAEVLPGAINIVKIKREN